MKTEDAPEIIEILDDDTSAFGERMAIHPPLDSGGSRWVGPLAAAVLIGLIGFGIATSASHGGTPEVAPAPTTTAAATQTTRPAPTTTVAPQPVVPYYAAEPPRGFKLQFVDFQREIPRYDTNPFQLWAQPGSTGTSGSWFTITYYSGDFGFYASNGANGYRLDSDTGPLVVTQTGPQRWNVHRKAGPAGSVYVSALGWSDTDLIRLASSIEVDRGAPSVPYSSLTAGYEMISAFEPWYAFTGAAVEQVYYSTSDDPSQGISISVAPLSELSVPGLADRQVAIRFLLDRATAFEVDGHPAVAGEIIDQPGSALASWIAGDHVVTVGGTLPVPELIAIARTVHTVSSSEWKGMQFQAIHNASEPGRSGDYTETTPLPVSYGTDTSGVNWTIRASSASFGEERYIVWEFPSIGGMAGFSTEATEAAQINAFADWNRTYVVANLPRTVAGVAELRVTPPGLDPVTVSFNDTDQALDRTFAAYAFTEPGRYSAEIVAAGAVLARWPSL